MQGISRALLIDTVDRGAGAPKRYRFRASSGGRARGDSYLLSPDGWDLDSYRNYPVILAFHNARSFPIGIATNLEVDRDGLIDEVEFDDGDPLGADAIRKLDRGIPIAQSVSFDVLETEPQRSADGSIQSKRQSLIEISMVGVPSDPTSLPLPARHIETLTTLESLLPRLERLVSDEHVPERPSTLLTALALVRQQAHGTADPDAATRAAIEATIRELQQVITPTTDISPAVLRRLKEIAGWQS